MQKISFILILLLIPNLVIAKTYISEIMYDTKGTDTGREWIEIHNDSEADIDLSTYFLYETNVAHKIVHISGPKIISKGGFAIIASDDKKFMIDYPGFSGSLFDSVFSLNNSGEELVLLGKDKNQIDLKVYSGDMGAGGTGNSLQISNGVFIPAVPTPGAINATEAVDESVDSESDTDSGSTASSSSSSSNTNSKIDNSTHSSQNSISDYSAKENIKIGIGRNRRVLINTPVDFTVSMSDDARGRFRWTFGNGGYSRGKIVEYSFNYPGKYNVVLNSYIDDRQITSRTIVEAIKPDFSIGVEDAHISIQNNLKEEVNIGEFVIRTESNSFVFPEDTILSANQKILINKADLPVGIMLGFFYPNGELVVNMSGN